MTERERLIELVLDCEKENDVLSCYNERPKKIQSAEIIADHLLANGVIVPPCKVGDKAYHLTSIDTLDELNVAEIFEGKVCSVSKEEKTLWFFCRYDNGLNFWYTERDIGKSIFLTKEEAEKALERSRQ